MEIKLADGIKVANQLTLGWREHPGLSRVAPMESQTSLQVKEEEESVPESMREEISRC